MKVSTILPGYRVCDYMIVLSPHEDLRNRIAKEREAFSEKFNVPTAVYRPHLLLVSFTQYELMEDRLVAKLKALAMGQYPFKVELKDFGRFPTHSIFINVTSKVPITNLVKSIRSSAQSLMKLDPARKPYFASEATVNIARKLQPWQYEKGWIEYAEKHFKGSFIANEMLLLKRYEEEKGWRVAQHLEFQNLPVSIKQGDLFG